MEFGIFDHVDRSGLPLAAFYEMRLKLCALYDRGGFRSYHVAEHHSTPIGMAPSPSVYLAAVAQRTRQLRFGPLVYLLPLYHPLRLLEEICMLDQMSGGRFELGVGRGVSPIEVGFYGLKPEDRVPVYAEALAVLRAGLADPTIDFAGEHYKFDDVPLQFTPFQKPHPPIWVGVERPDSAERAGRAGFNWISAQPVGEVTTLTKTYREAFAAEHGARALPLMGLLRFIVIADTDDEALAVARRAYPKWQQSLTHLPRTYGYATQNPRPPEFDAIRDGGRGIAGAPETVRDILRAQLAESGANYCVGQFAFGDLTFDEARRTIDLFVREVMPALA
jgi:alkanesulfonate monooxygenase SsuD/methylene tetrahydromethanopterin reductase-like flavin-dependent oxidoreductase (luciferase family)